jgi:hypothetical protein
LGLTKVLEFLIIDRSVPPPTTPAMKTPVKRNIQDMLMVEEKTPLMESDGVHSLSLEKKHLAQID